MVDVKRAYSFRKPVCFSDGKMFMLRYLVHSAPCMHVTTMLPHRGRPTRQTLGMCLCVDLVVQCIKLMMLLLLLSTATAPTDEPPNE